MAPFLAMAKLKQAWLCSSGLTKTFSNPRRPTGDTILTVYRASAARFPFAAAARGRYVLRRSTLMGGEPFFSAHAVWVARQLKNIVSMKKLFALAACIVLAAASAVAQDLKFNADGKFKILQLTDVHYNNSDASKAALQVLDNVISQEKPDLVGLTGDIIWGPPGKENLLTVLNRISKHNVPFVYEFGNHDWEQGPTNRDLYNLARGVKNNVLPDLTGTKELDYVVTIKDRTGKKDAALIYCLDSHAYPKGFPADKSKGTYAWLTFDQVNWYRQQSQAYKDANGGATLPALAFFHIGLPEFNQAADNGYSPLIGTRREHVFGPEFNSGMFTAMMEGGDIMGIFVGHDHNNDYTTLWHNIVLGFGRYSGGNTVYNHLKAGARVIVLEEGQRRFSSHIREWDGNVCNSSVYPDSYVDDDWTKRPLQKYE